MKRLLLLVFLCAPMWAQCTIQAFSGSQPKSIAPGLLNSNFNSLNDCKATVFTGTNPPTTVTGSVKGSLFVDSTHGLAYQCFGAGPCTAVATGNWVCINCGTGSGTVTVVGAGNLTSTAIMTGGGSQTAQTAAPTATMDSSGNISTPGGLTTGTGGSNPGTLYLGATTVSGLPTCNSGAQGTHASVNDANATTFLSTVAGGGSNKVPVYCNGTNWVIG